MVKDPNADASSWSGLFSPDEVAVLEFATRLCHHSDDIGAELVERLRSQFSQRQLAELLLGAGQANMWNRVGEGAKQLLDDAER